jgi:hypothetical protein
VGLGLAVEHIMKSPIYYNATNNTAWHGQVDMIPAAHEIHPEALP